MLRGPQVRRLWRGVYVAAGVELSFWDWLCACFLVLPLDAAASHTTALRVYGIDLGRPWPLHFSTNTAAVCEHREIRLHRRVGRLHTQIVRQIRVLGPDRTVLDCARLLNPVQLIQAMEALIHAGWTTRDQLAAYLTTCHLDGVVRARRAFVLVREGSESVMETLLRLMIVFARLPEPACNADIRDARGRFVARGDLVLARWKVLVEYDGWQHERDAGQRAHDLRRREDLEAAGWRLVVVTVDDLKDPHRVVRRVHAALTSRGYVGPPPACNTMWTSWFASPV
ncbi:DUF559 domain-containing protein [Solicola sp. PLA-1-18]|uniref:DUF559 domain-containing protein n=1 Tax=Solicola sp. PLA-1-18 TaxID=3380532 RepID=UPI003B7F2F47